jgi:uncharacterized membrane protein YcaP (DUF421 family)
MVPESPNAAQPVASTKAKTSWLRMRNQDVMTAARNNGLQQMGDIQNAIVERDGSISIIKGEQKKGDQDNIGEDEPPRRIKTPGQFRPGG